MRLNFKWDVGNKYKGRGGHSPLLALSFTFTSFILSIFDEETEDESESGATACYILYATSMLHTTNDQIRTRYVPRHEKTRQDKKERKERQRQNTRPNPESVSFFVFLSFCCLCLCLVFLHPPFHKTHFKIMQQMAWPFVVLSFRDKKRQQMKRAIFSATCLPLLYREPGSRQLGKWTLCNQARLVGGPTSDTKRSV